MKRRNLLQLPLAIALAKASHSAAPPWSAQLLKGGFDGTYYWSGIAITLATGWKTYWRVPGDGGISPSFEITGQNLKSHLVEYPAPSAFQDAAGLTIGYKHHVVFPIALVPQDPNLPVLLNLKSFFGVCEVVCIPAQFDASLTFDPQQSEISDQATISEWRDKVPKLEAIGPVQKAIAKQGETKLRLQLELSEAVEFVFVEGNPLHYFSNPLMMRGLAVFDVTGAKSLDELRAIPLRITVKPKYSGKRTLEQMVSVL